MLTALKKHPVCAAAMLASAFVGLPALAQEAPKRPSITGIDHVRLYVRNLDKSHDFYANILRLPLTDCPRDRALKFCFLVSPSPIQRIELQQAPAETKNWKLKNWIYEIGFATDHVGQMRRYLMGRGAIPGGLVLTDSDGAHHLEVPDPEGNRVSFVERPPTLLDYKTVPSPLSSRLIHAGFVVKNLDTENHFYRDLLGFRLYWQGGFKDDGLDWYEIQAPDGDNWIEYMLNIPASADHAELGVQNHFSLAVKDIQATAEQLRKNGLTKFDGPEIGRDGKWSLDAYDPDGTRIEFMEFAPAKEPCCHPYTAEHPKP